MAYRPGLRSRLVLVTMLATALAVAAISFGVQLLLSRSARSESVDLLRARTDAVAATVRLVAGRPMVLETPADSLDQNVWVFDAAGRTIDGTVPAGLRHDIDQLKGLRTERTVVAAGETRLLARPIASSGQNVAVVVAGLDLTPYERSERRGLWLTIGLGALIVLSAGLAAWAAARHALRQVHRMVRRADEWQEHDLQGRFDLGPPVDELTELGGTLDRMLDRIASALRAERRLTDEVAHELRTPLTVIRSEAQLAVTADPAAKDDSLQAIVAATVRMETAIQTMLQVARSSPDGEARCDAGAVLSTVLATVRGTVPASKAVQAHASVRVDHPRQPLGIAAPQAVVCAALSPLVDNAVRHAPGQVRLSARRDGRRVVLIVEDDGPGVAPESVEEIFRGAGLGLALARRLAGSVGGRVTAVATGHGRFELDLPSG
jgi:two-component system, OmpR family, sensor kinase